MSNTIIKLENISKQYRLGQVGTQTLRGDLQRWWHTLRGKEDPTLKIGASNKLDSIEGEYVWALKDINLEVKQGEILGVIGKNGAGKSTLLKLLSRVTSPTTGSIKVKGRIASLLEVGTGFHPELTGRENIFLNGAIMGMTKAEIKSKFDEIIDFSGVAKYVDTPVKRYSSGMYVRLAFAVAAHLEPDILVVDEVLAVGDAEFQKKAIGKMQDISSGGGRTVLFVSHNMDSIRKLCSTGILLKNGMINFIGSINETIEAYISIKKNNSTKVIEKYVTEDLYLEKAFIIGEKEIPTNQILIGEKWKVKLLFSVKEEIKNVTFGVGITTITDIPINTTWSEPKNLKSGSYEIEFISNEIFFQKGTFKVLLGLSIGKISLFYEEDFFQFEVTHISKEINDNLIKIDGTTGIILNQLLIKTNKINLVQEQDK